jgi:signal transduction histidine kinase
LNADSPIPKTKCAFRKSAVQQLGVFWTAANEPPPHIETEGARHSIVAAPDFEQPCGDIPRRQLEAIVGYFIWFIGLLDGDLASRLNQEPCSTHIMKRKLISLSQGYAKALLRHLKQSSRSSLRSAHELGRTAVVLGIETLDLARIHELAMTTLNLSGIKNGLVKRAVIFFNEANTLIEQTHQQTNGHLGQLKKMLILRTEQLASTNRQLKRGVARRKVMEIAFEKTGRSHRKHLEESLDLQKCLRQLTHQAFAAQEYERRKISRELQDEIVQTLLSINVQLLSMKQQAGRSTTGLTTEIANTQRVVLKSAKSVRRVAREFRNA